MREALVNLLFIRIHQRWRFGQVEILENRTILSQR